MRFDADQLRRKALIALEEAVQECRYRQPRRTIAVRFALAYLWSNARCGRAPFDRFWRALGDPKSPWSFSAADGALLAIYIALGLERDDKVGMALWKRLHREALANVTPKRTNDNTGVSEQGEGSCDSL